MHAPSKIPDIFSCSFVFVFVNLFRSTATDVCDEASIAKRRKKETRIIIQNLKNAFKKRKKTHRKKSKSLFEMLGMKLLKKVLDNLVITIRNIHIRFVDTTSFSETPFALGICLESITIPPNEPKTNKSKTPREKAVSRKLKLIGLVVYMYMGDAVTSGLLFNPSWNHSDFQLAMDDIFRVTAGTYMVRMLLHVAVLVICAPLFGKPA